MKNITIIYSNLYLFPTYFKPFQSSIIYNIKIKYLEYTL